MQYVLLLSMTSCLGEITAHIELNHLANHCSVHSAYRLHCTPPSNLKARKRLPVTKGLVVDNKQLPVAQRRVKVTWVNIA